MTNQWGVTFEATEEQIAEDLKRWDWGDETDPVSVAKLVLQVIGEQTMASIEADGTIVMGLFEFEMPLKIPLAVLIEDWIDGRVEDGKIYEEYAEEAGRLAELFERLAAKLRSPLSERAEVVHNSRITQQK